MQTKRATLTELDGLSFRRNEARLPWPWDLSRWEREGLYYIDAENDCFRLTQRGKDK